MKVKCIGSVHVNFTNEQTGEVINGYTCYFVSPERNEKEHGLHVLKKFVTAEKYRQFSMEGAFNNGKEANIEFGERGQLLDFKV